eukprot:jgi/Astpho2/481/Aster-03526
MKCGGCSASVKRILEGQPGVQAAAVNLLTESAVVRVPSTVDLELFGPQAAQALTQKGFPSKVRSGDEGLLGNAEQAEASKQVELRRSMLDLAIAWSLALICCTHHLGHWLHSLGLHSVAHLPVLNTMHQVFSNPAASAALGAFALLGPGRKLLVDGSASLARGNPNMNSLIGLGAATSFTAGAASLAVPGMGLEVSFLEEPVMLLAFVLLGRALESRARLKASADLRTLARLIPAQSRLVLDAPSQQQGPAADHEPDSVSVPTSSVRAGDLLRVLPGERIPVDGEVLQGTCSVDESMLTGESVLVAKQAGAQVTAGTVNYEGPITVKATSTGADSTLAGIGRLVADAQGREAPVQRLADSVAGKFCWTIMAASAATFSFWAAAGGALFPSVIEAAGMSGGNPAVLLGLKLAVDVMVVACPCALGLATPTAVLVASSVGARRGLLLRGGDVLERLAAVDVVAFDKTGTLTQGRLRLVGMHAGEGVEEGQLLAWAAAVERSTRHPLADAVMLAARQQQVEVPGAAATSTEPGLGARGTVGDQQVAVGKLDWVQQQAQLDSNTHPESLGASLQGQSVVYVGVQGRGVVGALGFADTLRSDAQGVVQQLKHMGTQVLLLSGDTQPAVDGIAQQAGIADGSAWGGMRPEQKAAFVRQLREQGKVVAMVGDGVNDAPALAAADVGIAVSGGMDAAGEAASVVLMGDRLGQVVEAIDLGRATLGKIKQNLVWALIYNMLGVPLAAGALLPVCGIALNPSVAGGMMAFSSLAVVTNSLMLRAQFGQQGLPLHAQQQQQSSPSQTPQTQS